MRKLKTLSIAFVLIFVMSAFTMQKPVTVFMIGESTMANKDTTGGKQERGWGMMLQQFFKEGVIVDNHAMNGRSSKSFIDEGRWNVVLDKIKPGDYVIIQFGHNDEKPAADRHTDCCLCPAEGPHFVRSVRSRYPKTRNPGRRHPAASVPVSALFPTSSQTDSAPASP